MIDVDGALALLDRALADHGEDHIYSDGPSNIRCTYAYEGRPSCIVGHAMHFAGVAVAQLEALDGRDGGSGVDWLYKNGELPLAVTRGAARVLQVAQEAQDGGYAWGLAVERARVVAESYREEVPA